MDIINVNNILATGSEKYGGLICLPVWVEPAHFYDLEYIMYNIPDEQSTIYKFLFRDKPPKRVYKISLTEAILEMVKTHLGVAVLPNWIIRPYRGW